jgi:methyl-accepting chemotaxis protein
MVDKAGNALTSIIAQVSSVGDLVSEIAGGVQHQSQGLEDINTAMRELDAVTQQNTAMAEEASASSQLLQSEARTLSSVTGRFQIDPPMSTDAPASWDDGSDTPAASHEATG